MSRARYFIPVLFFLVIIMSFGISAVEQPEVEGLLADTQGLMDMVAQDAAADPASSTGELQYFRDNQGEMAPDVAGSVDSALSSQGVDPDATVASTKDGAQVESSSSPLAMIIIIVVIVLLVIGGGVLGYKKRDRLAKAGSGAADKVVGIFSKADRFAKISEEKYAIATKNLELAETIIKAINPDEERKLAKARVKVFEDNIALLRKHNFPTTTLSLGKEIITKQFEARRTDLKADLGNDAAVDKLLAFVLKLREKYIHDWKIDVQKIDIYSYDFSKDYARLAMEHPEEVLSSSTKQIDENLKRFSKLLQEQKNLLPKRIASNADADVKSKLQHLNEVVLYVQAQRLEDVLKFFKVLSESDQKSRYIAVQSFKRPATELKVAVMQELDIEKELLQKKVKEQKEVKKEEKKKEEPKKTESAKKVEPAVPKPQDSKKDAQKKEDAARRDTVITPADKEKAAAAQVEQAKPDEPVDFNGKKLLKSQYVALKELASQFKKTPEEMFPEGAVCKIDGKDVQRLVVGNGLVLQLCTDGFKVTGFFGKVLKIPAEFSALKKLVCSDNGFTKLVLPDSLSQIREFDCRDNELKELNLPKELPVLQVLFCGGNVLKELVLPEKMPNLAILACSGNNIKKMVIPSTFVKLTHLNVANNPKLVLELPDKLPSLKVVWCEKTSVNINWVNKLRDSGVFVHS